MHLYRFRILENLIKKSADDAFIRSIYRRMGQSNEEELLIIRHQKDLEVFIVGPGAEDCLRVINHLFQLDANLSGGDKPEINKDREALRYFLELFLGMHSGLPADPNQFLHIKEEFNLALDEGAVGTILSNIYREGERLGTIIQSDPVIQNNCISFPDILLDITSKISGDLSGFQFIILGGDGKLLNKIISAIRKDVDRKIYFLDEDFNEAYRRGLALGCIPIDTTQLLTVLDNNTVILDFSASGDHLLEKYSKNFRDYRNRLYIYFNLSGKKLENPLSKLSNFFIQNKNQVSGLIDLHTKNRLENLYSFKHMIDDSINRFYDWLYSADRFVFENMVSADKRMQKVFELMRRIAPSDVNVVIYGETGTGKELIARALHNRSSRASRPFVAVNCSAIPETLLESELFGYVKGAFTGAYTSKKGLVEIASGGTLFLDEIGDLPPIIQVKLLRVLQEREIMRLGGTSPEKVDIRLVTATNHDLEQMVIEGKFRSDLYYRVNTVQINLPALRERKEDIPILTKFFINILNRKSGKHINRISDNVHEKFSDYDWPGNIRELENIIERAFAVSVGEEITLSDLPKRMQEFTGTHLVFPVKKNIPVESLKELEAARIKDLLINKNITLSESAKILGIGRTTLWRKMREYGINKNESDGKFDVN